MHRTYECRNTDCPNFRIPQVVQARQVGIFWEYPRLVCDCNGAEVPIVAVNGKPVD